MKRITALLLFAAGIIPAKAQENLSLTFREAVQIGLENNIPLKQERNNLTGRVITKNSSYASLAPSINARALASRANGNFFLEQTGEVINAISQNLFGTLDANVVIYNGSSRLNAAKRDKKLFEAQLSTIARTEQDVINNVALQYLTLLQDQEQAIIAKQNLDNQNVLLDQITGFFETGSRPITDKYDQDYQVKSAELEVIRAENRLINDKAILAQTLLIDPRTNFDLMQPGWDVEEISVENYTMEGLYQTAMDNREDLKSIQFQEAAAMRNVKAQKGGYIPSLSAFYGISSRWSDATLGRDVGEQLLIDNKRQTFGVNLNIPIFNGLQNRSRMVNARVQHENALLGVENQEILIKTEVIRSYQNFRDVALAYQVSIVQFEAGERSMETQRESYNLGITSLIELSRALNVFVEGQTSLSRAKYALLFQKIIMDYAMGTLSFEDIPN